MPSDVKPKLLELLLEKQAISRTSMQLLEDFCQRWQVAAYDAIIETNILTESELSTILANYFSIDRYFEIEQDDLKESLETTLNFAAAKKFCCLPIGFADKDMQTLKIVVADPTNEEYINSVKNLTGKKIVLAVANQSAIIRKIHEVYPPEIQLSSTTSAGMGT